MLLRSLSRFFVAFAWLGRLRVVLDSPKNLILQTYCIWLEYITLLWFVKSFLIIFSWLKLIPNVQVWKYRCLESVWTSLFPKSSQLNVSNIPQPPRSIYIHSVPSHWTRFPSTTFPPNFSLRNQSNKLNEKTRPSFEELFLSRNESKTRTWYDSIVGWFTMA